MNELTTIQRAELALNFDAIKSQALELVKDSARIVKITDKAGYQECHAARMRLRDARVSVEKTGKEARDDANKFAKSVIAKENELIAIMEPEEKRLAELQKAVDDEAERVKAEKARIERERIEAINARFAAIKSLPLGAMNATASEIQKIIEHAEAIDEASFPEDMQPAAKYEKRLAITSLRAALDARNAHDAEQVRIQAEREELAKLRAEQEALQAERERLAHVERELKEEAERAERQRIAAERAEAQRVEDEKRAEEKRAFEAEQAQAREEARKAAEALATEQAEARKREQAAAEKLAKERAKLEADKKAAAKAARDAEIANASLTGAASEALQLLKSEGYGEHLVTQKLESALTRNQQKEAA